MRARPGSGAIAMTAGTTPVTYTPKFAYVANQDTNTVSAYTINAGNGTLGTINLGVITGTSPRSVTVDPAGRFAYVANIGSNIVSAYTIDAGTGALSRSTPIRGRAVRTSRRALAPLPLPSILRENSLTSANFSSNSVSAYTINAGTGALFAVTAVRSWRSVGPVSVTVDPTGRFAYVANSGSVAVSAYTINATTGALSAGVACLPRTAPAPSPLIPLESSLTSANCNSNTRLGLHHRCRQRDAYADRRRSEQPAFKASGGNPTQSQSPSIRRANLLTWRTAAPTAVSAFTHQSQHRRAHRHRGSGACRKQSAIRHRRSFGQVRLHGKFQLQHRLGVQHRRRHRCAYHSQPERGRGNRSGFGRYFRHDPVKRPQNEAPRTHARGRVGHAGLRAPWMFRRAGSGTGSTAGERCRRPPTPSAIHAAGLARPQWQPQAQSWR